MDVSSSLLSHAITGLTCIGVAVPAALKLVKRNGKERRNGNHVSQHECELIHKGLDDRLAEGNNRMERIEQQIASTDTRISEGFEGLSKEVGRLQGAQEK